MDKLSFYLDNAASMPVNEDALSAAMPFITEHYGNPSSLHKKSMAAANALLESRKSIAYALGAQPGDVFFTSGGTESDNWALRSAARVGAAAGRNHIVTTALEHHAILNTCADLEKDGFSITYLPPDRDGYITPQQVSSAITDQTCLVSVMLANNEIGTLQPIKKIAAVCRRKGVPLHTDAVQAVGHLPVDVQELGVDMLSFSGHKFGAMKGVGGLYIRSGFSIPPLIYGGGQEYGMRSGTEPVAQIVSMATALSEMTQDIYHKIERTEDIRDQMINDLLQIPGSHLNGGIKNRLAGNVNISFSGVESESLLLMLDMRGICASGGSACTSSSKEPSHVLRAIGTSEEYIKGSLRLTFEDDLTASDVEYIVDAVRDSVEKLRALRNEIT